MRAGPLFAQVELRTCSGLLLVQLEFCSCVPACRSHKSSYMRAWWPAACTSRVSCMRNGPPLVQVKLHASAPAYCLRKLRCAHAHHPTTHISQTAHVPAHRSYGPVPNSPQPGSGSRPEGGDPCSTSLQVGWQCKDSIKTNICSKK